MAGNHGGARPGAGRKRKDRTPQGHYESAEDYLRAVVRGDVAPDAIRVAAAKALIAYERAKQRAPVKSLSPGQLRAKTEMAIEESNVAEFHAKAAEILKKYRRT